MREIMSWNRIVLPLRLEICPETVEIGKIAWDCYRRAKQPAGFAMFHATEGSEDGLNDKRIVYLSPVASEVCSEINEKYPFEKCGTPARDEPNIAFVFGDPVMMGQLLDSVSLKAAAGR
jgi:hypothetical protein